MSNPPPLPQYKVVEYRSRTTAFDKEQSLLLENDNLVIVQSGQAIATLPLSTLNQINLRFSPSRFQRNRYECILHWQSGRSMKICNQFFAGMADFVDQSPDYNSWVRELHQLVPTLSPSCRFLTGTSMLSYLLNATFLIAVFLLLVLIMLLMWTSIPAIAIVKLVIIAFYIPILVKWFRRNKPGTYNPATIPDSLLPP